MNSLDKSHEITLRLDHLEEAGDWIARATVHNDAAASHTGTLVTVLADDLRQRVLDLVTELEKQIVLTNPLH